MPVRLDIVEKLLVESDFDKIKWNKVIEGVTHGFALGYQGPEDVQLESPNLKFRGVGNEVILWNKVMKEVKLKQYAGPFKKPPFKNIQSPIVLLREKAL